MEQGCTETLRSRPIPKFPKKSQRNQLLGTPLEKNPIENPENPIEPPPQKKTAPSPLQASKLLTPSMVSPSRFAPKPASEAMAREAPSGWNHGVFIAYVVYMIYVVNIYIYMYIYVYIYVCMYVCMYVYMYVCMYNYVYIYMYIYIYIICLSVCLCVYMDQIWEQCPFKSTEKKWCFWKKNIVSLRSN